MFAVEKRLGGSLALPVKDRLSVNGTSVGSPHRFRPRRSQVELQPFSFRPWNPFGDSRLILGVCFWVTIFADGGDKPRRSLILLTAVLAAALPLGFAAIPLVLMGCRFGSLA